MDVIQNSSIPSSDYRDLPLTQLVESPTNPRKRYDEASLEELAESIRSQGVLAPLLVRAMATDKYEIVAGSRRFRAAKLAGTDSIPVRVVQLSDADALVAQVIENLQRENVHPLEEAQGFRALLDLPDQQYTIARIGERAGKNASYVAARLRLTELIPDAADAFLADRLTIGHALLIAKLPPAQQQEAFKAAFKSTWMTSGQTEILIPAKELAAWIESNLLLDLQTAPFDQSDAGLVPDAGSCHDCAKRTGANSLLFPESNHDQCLDGACFQTKLAAHVSVSVERDPQLIQISSAWGTHSNSVLGRGQYVEIAAKTARNGHGKLPPERKKCPSIAKAIVVEGGNCGRIVDVCADPACETHHADSRKASEAHKRMRVESRKQDQHRKQELATRNRVLAAILDKVTAPLSKADLDLVIREYVNRLPQEHRTILTQRHSPSPANGKQPKPSAEIGSTLKNLDEAGYSRLLIEISLLDATYNAYSRDGSERLEAVAKRYRVNVGKIADSVATEFAARSKKREEQKVSRNGKSGPRSKTARKRTGA
jgi:ParB family chromosome partitioning protein